MLAKQCRQRTNVFRRRKTRGRRALCCRAPSIVAGSSALRRLEFGRPSRQILHTGCVPQTSRQAFARGMALPIAPIQNPRFRNPRMPRSRSRSTSFFAWCESEKESVGREQFVLHDDLNALISMHFASCLHLKVKSLGRFWSPCACRASLHGLNKALLGLSWMHPHPPKPPPVPLCQV